MKGKIPSKYKNKGFIQINVSKIEEILCLANYDRNAPRIFAYMLKRMDSDNRFYCSYEELISRFDLSERTLSRAIKVLREKNMLLIQRQESTMTRVYIINPDYLWQARANKVKIATIELFQANANAMSAKNKP